MLPVARNRMTPLAAACAIALLASSSARAEDAKPAQPDVAAANQAVLSQLPFDDARDFEDASRGFIATVPGPASGAYAAIKGEAPPTVNPSLWRQAQLDAINGLFEVTSGVYQVRGFSVAAMTIVEGKTGVIVIDTLASPGEAKAALDLYFAHRPKKPVLAVIYTHDHGDHWGGARAVLSAADAGSGKVKVIAPLGFMPALIEEASVAANLAGRRGQFQFGATLPVGAQGTVDYGEGETVTRGTPGPGPIIAPNDIVKKPFERRTIDGVRFVFQLANDTEAPAEMFVYLPDKHVLDMAEADTHTLHNLLPLRGTLVRNAQSWSRALNTALDNFGDAEILINQHQWPLWGKARVRASLENHRDLYQYVHDQTLRMMNEGMGPADIAEKLAMPPGLEKDFSLRGYYGTLSQAAKAVYQRYAGWYDGNPANLNRLPPAEEARKQVEYMGGAEAAIARARDDFAKGNYRWVAQVMDQVAAAEPANKAARDLLADAFEQMAYQAEAAPWRNSYLLAAKELRGRVAGSGAARVPAITAQVLHAMTAGEMFDYLGTRIDGPRAGAARIQITWRFTDSKEAVASTLSHGALTWTAAKPDAKDSVIATRAALEAVILGNKSLADAMADGGIRAGANAQPLAEFWALLVDFPANPPLVAPAG